jgi:hypothetical protein
MHLVKKSNSFKFCWIPPLKNNTNLKVTSTVFLIKNIEFNIDYKIKFISNEKFR